MAVEATIEAHVDAVLKQRAEAIYASAGLTLDQAFRSMLEKTVRDGYVSMDSFRPNAETLEAIQELRNGGGTEGTLADLFNEIDADD